MKTLASMGAALAMALSLAACAENRHDDRILSGAAIGGVAGALIGGATTGRVGGAVAGGVIGAAGGAIIAGATDQPRRYRRRCYVDEYGYRTCN